MKVERKRLGREKAWGLAFLDENRVVVDPDLEAKHELEIFVHEFMHIADKKRSEEKVTHDAKVVAENLWRIGYRMVKLS